MTANTSHPRWLWPVLVLVVTLLAFGLRWYYVATAMVIHPVRGDALHYVAYAWNLVHHGVFSSAAAHAETVVPDSYRDPGYPVLVAVWMKLFSRQALWYAGVLMTQAILGALTVPLAMQLGRRWLPVGWATTAGVLMAVWPHSIVITSDLLTETLFGFLCALAMLVAARACDRRSRTWAIIAGLCFGAAALTNAVLLPFGVLLALYLAWRTPLPRHVWLALLIGAVILPGAWAVRNVQLPTGPEGHSAMHRATQNLVQGSWPVYHAAYGAMVNGDPRGRAILDEINAETRLLENKPASGAGHMLHRLGQRPLRFLGWYTLEKPHLLWGWRIRMGQNDIYTYGTKNSPFDHNPAMRGLVALAQVVNPALAALMLCCLVGVIVRHVRRRDGPDTATALQAVLCLAVYVTFVYTVLQSEPRYSIPFRSFEMLLAVTSVSAAIAWLRRKRRPDT